MTGDKRMETSTRLQYARDECCQWQDGHCIGVPMLDWPPGHHKPRGIIGGRPGVQNEGDPCVFKGNALSRCEFFDKSIAPMAAKRGIRLSDYTPPPKAKAKVRNCPDCGSPLPPRKQYCAACVERRKRAFGRQRTRRHRVEGEV